MCVLFVSTARLIIAVKIRGDVAHCLMEGAVRKKVDFFCRKKIHCLVLFCFFVSWLLHFYDHCLWSSMTHINGRCLLPWQRTAQFNVSPLPTQTTFEMSSSFFLPFCLDLLGLVFLHLWKTLITFPCTGQ